MIKDYFLRAESRESLEQALINSGLLFYADNELLVKEGVSIDYVGVIYESTGIMLIDNEGFEYPEQVAVDGYHANIRAELTAEKIALLPIIDTPRKPQRIFAGGIL